MDAYCVVRFTYLCLRICIFASIWGLIVLTPLYAYGNGDAEGMYVITLANVESGSPKLVRIAILRCWVSRRGMAILKALWLIPAAPSMYCRYR